MSLVFEDDGRIAIWTPEGQQPIRYARLGHVYYHASTPHGVADRLEQARMSGQRIRISLGHTDPAHPQCGRDWMEENDVEGYVGNSTGALKVPLLLSTKRSHGGGAILDHCIVRILQMPGRKLWWTHQRYSRPRMGIAMIAADSDHHRELLAKGYTHSVTFDEQVNANFRSIESARRYLKKMS